MNNASPLISVIVPVYGVEEYLPACIDSIIAQTYENLEIILVDDGSPDNCGKICDAYAEKDSRIKVIHKENGGVSSARNAGLDIASGEYIGFVDSDDTANTNMFESLYAELEKNGADVSVCGHTRIERGEKSHDEQTKTLSFSPEEAIKNILIGKYFCGQLWNKLFKFELLKKVRFDESLYVYEDMLFSVEAILKSKKICYSNEPLYNYFIRETSALRSTFNEKQFTAHSACIKTLELLNAHGLGHLKKYSDTQILLCNLTFIHRLFYTPEHRKVYCKIAVQNIKKHLTKESFSQLSKGNQIKISLIFINYRLYFLALKLYSRQEKNRKDSCKQ